MNDKEIDKHSVNCYYCGDLKDERECADAGDYNGNDGGSICRDCQITHPNIEEDEFQCEDCGDVYDIEDSIKKDGVYLCIGCSEKGYVQCSY